MLLCGTVRFAQPSTIKAFSGFYKLRELMKSAIDLKLYSAQNFPLLRPIIISQISRNSVIIY